MGQNLDLFQHFNSHYKIIDNPYHLGLGYNIKLHSTVKLQSDLNC